MGGKKGDQRNERRNVEFWGEGGGWDGGMGDG